jgi:spore coat polysaccharide biosynthesis predicted glycosyltransferase SpsG
MELLLGNYFFVKYEDDLAKLFTMLYEPEEYEDLIKTSATIVTASAQTALEAKVSGAKVIYIALKDNPLYDRELLEKYGILTIDGFDISALQELLDSPLVQEMQSIQKIDISTILN